MKFNILELKIISQEVLQYYINNPEIAKEDYKKITTNNRGLDKTILDGYYEIHHIIPKCMGGTNEDNNLVLLTYEEHIKAHMLLYTIYSDNLKLMMPFRLMLNVRSLHELNVDILVLEKLKKEFSESIKGDNNPVKREDVRRKISQTKLNMHIKLSPEDRKKMSESRKGRKNKKPSKLKGKKKPKEIVEKISKSLPRGENHFLYGKHLSDEVKKKISNSLKGRKLPPVSKETRKKLSESAKNRIRKSRKIQASDGVIYESAIEAAKVYKVSPKTIRKWAKNLMKNFRYIKD